MKWHALGNACHKKGVTHDFIRSVHLDARPNHARNVI